MLKVHRNILFETIISTGISTSHFQFQEPVVVRRSRLGEFFNGQPIPSSRILARSEPRLWFRFFEYDYNMFKYQFTRFLKDYPGAIVCPDDERDKDGKLIKLITSSIEEIRPIFLDWLVKEFKPFLKELSSIDLWTNSTQIIYESDENFSFFDFTNINISSFTSSEKEHVRNGVSNFKRLIIQDYNPDPEILEKINQKLDYLTEALERLNKFDWQSLLLSIITSISINLTVDTRLGSDLLSLFQRALTTLPHLLP